MLNKFRVDTHVVKVWPIGIWSIQKNIFPENN